jgi:predicted transport protein
MKKLNNDIVDTRLVDRKIKRLDNYINSWTAINFQCLVETCMYIWKTRTDDIFGGHGCPQCSGNAKLNNKVIDEKLINRNIKRIGNYVNNHTEIDFECLVNTCGYIWNAAPASILNIKSGCPQCAGLAPLTNKIIDQRLGERNIRRLDNCVNAMTEIGFQCLIQGCNFIWKTSPNGVLNNKTGCPRCGGKLPLNNKIVDERLIGKNIQRMDEIINGATLCRFKCLIDGCGYVWQIIPNNINGCPQCAGTLKLNNQNVDERLKNRNVKRLGDYINNHTAIDFQCLVNDCGYIWKAKPKGILNREEGCPACGVGKNAKLIFDLLKLSGIKFQHEKLIKEIIPNVDKNLRADFYLPLINTIIEYNGRQHYQPVCFGGISLERAIVNFKDQHERDNYKQQLCDDNNIKLIWIDGREYIGSKLEKYVMEQIIPMIKESNK